MARVEGEGWERQGGRTPRGERGHLSPDWMKTPAGDSGRSPSASCQLPGNRLPPSPLSPALPSTRSCFSRVGLFAAPWAGAARLLCPLDSPGKNTRAGGRALPQGVFPTQGPCRVGHICLSRQVGSLPRAPPKPSGAPSRCQSRECSVVAPLTAPQDPAPPAPQTR